MSTLKLTDVEFTAMQTLDGETVDTLSRAATRLVKRGLLNYSDGRVIITPLGKSAMKLYQNQIDRNAARILAGDARDILMTLRIAAASRLNELSLTDDEAAQLNEAVGALQNLDRLILGY